MTYFLQTISNKKLNICDIHENDVCIEDIAHNLSLFYYYGSQISLEKNYSQALRNIYITQYLRQKNYDKRLQAAALLYGSAQAYMSFIVLTKKNIVSDWGTKEKALQDTIYRKYKLNLNRTEKNFLVYLNHAIIKDEIKGLNLIWNETDLNILSYMPLGIEICTSNSSQNVYSIFMYWCKKVNLTK